MYVIGIDPGPVCGVARLHLTPMEEPGYAIDSAEAAQVTTGLLPVLLRGFDQHGAINAIAIEAFVVGPRAARSKTSAAGTAARDVIGEVKAWAREKMPLHIHSAADVKPWATDDRLRAAGVAYAITDGMRHARDAMRHALYTAVLHYNTPDPLSSRFRRQK